jgi:hypothetical protein
VPRAAGPPPTLIQTAAAIYDADVAIHGITFILCLLKRSALQRRMTA